MAFDISRQPIEVSCPKCRRKVRTTLWQIEQRMARCSCGLEIRSSESVGREIREVNQSIERLCRGLKSLDLKITI